MLFTVALAACGAVAGAAASPKRPNVLFILVDDWGWNDGSFHGSEQIPTPNIDSIAKQGFDLDRFYVAPVCSPTRSTLYSGRVTTSTGIYDPFLVPHNASLDRKCNQDWSGGDCLLLPELLAPLGYRTKLIGKWHVGASDWGVTPLARGFDEYEGYLLGEQDHFTHVRANGFDLWNGTSIYYDEYGTYATDIYGPAAEAYIRGMAGEQAPWLLAVMTQTQHAPVQSPARCWGRFNATIPEGPRRIEAGMMSCLDDAVGGILRALDESGQANDTVVIIHADNGGIASSSGSNMPLLGQKHTLWEGGVRGIAAIAGAGVQSPGSQASARNNSRLLHVSDWYMSLASMAARGIDDSAASLPESQTLLWWLHETQMATHGRSGTPQRLLQPGGADADAALATRLRAAPPFSQWDGMDAWDAFRGAAPSPRDWILHAAPPPQTSAVDAQWLYRQQPLDSQGMTTRIGAAVYSTARPKETDLPVRAHGDLLGAYAAVVDGTLWKLVAGSFQTDDQQWFTVPGQNFTEQFTVRCGSPPRNGNGCEPKKQPCLFNLDEDPCEHQDRFADAPDVVKTLRARLQAAQSTAHAPVVGALLPDDCQPSARNNWTWIPCYGTKPQ